MGDTVPISKSYIEAMKKNEVKKIVSDYLIKMMNEWFPDKVLVRAFGITAIQANVNKFDGIIDMITDDNGDVNIDGLVDNLGEYLDKDLTIDLTTISPFLPQRILIITKSDMQTLIQKLKG